MNDEHDEPSTGPGEDGEPSPWAADGTSPPPPPSSPPSAPPGAAGSDPLTLEPETFDQESEVRSGGIGARTAALVVGLVLLLGGVGFAATQLGGDEGSPEDAMADLFQAIEDEDVLGALATLDPGERDTLIDPSRALVAELQRLEVLGEGFRLDGLSGVDVEFENLTFRVEEVRDDLARVYLTGGSGTAAYNTDELELGDFLTDVFDRFGVDYQGHSDTTSSEFPEPGTEDEFLVAYKGSDGWRISIGYSAVEHARLDGALGPAPARGQGLTPIGADSPEAAVEGLLRAATDFDVPGLVARLSPNEFRALHDYWSLLVDPADLPPGPAELGAIVELDDIDLRADVDGDAASVYVDGFTFTVGTTGPDGFAITVALADGCVEITGDLDRLEELGFDPAEFVDGPVCREDYMADFDEQMADLDLNELGLDVDLDFSVFESVRTPDLGVIVHQVDGAWYVAPISTYYDGTVAVLAALDREHLDAAVDIAEAFVDAFTASFTGSGFNGEFETLEPGSGFGFETSDPFALDPDDEAAVRALLSDFHDDPFVVDCAYFTLVGMLSSEQLAEIVVFAEGGPPPSFSAEDTVFFSLESCGG